MLLKAVLIGVILELGLVDCAKYNVSYEMLAKCKEYDAVAGYNYNSFFKIDELANLSERDDLLSLRLSVLASKDAHILLSSTSSPKSDELVIEIVLGAGANKFSEIRKQRKTSPLITVSTVKLLSPIDPLPLILTVKKSGLISVTIDGQIMPIMTASLDTLFDIKYLSFSSWGTTEAKWFYDCPSSTVNITQVERPLSTVERLEKDLFIDYDAYKIPENLDKVTITSLTVKKVSFNIKKSLMETLATVVMAWEDEKLAWDASEYDNTAAIKGESIRNFWVWRPTLKLINGIDLTFFDDMFLTLTLYANGTITAKSSPFTFTTWCSQNDTLQQWPNEKLICDIVLAVSGRNITLLHDGSIEFDLLSEQSEWSLTNLAKAAVEFDADDILNEVDVVYDNEEDDSSSQKGERKQLDLSFRFYLQRNQQFYEKVFFTPLLGAFLMMLLSFWCSGHSRMALTLLSTLILAASFVFITRHAPLSYVPMLMKFYQISLVLSWFSFILVMIDSWLESHPPLYAPPTILVKIAEFSILRIALGLERINIYDNLKRPDSTWKELKNVVDRIVFIGFALFFGYMLFIGY